MLIPLYLFQRGRLSTPIFYMTDLRIQRMQRGYERTPRHRITPHPAALEY
jgi:hypothetical protein